MEITHGHAMAREDDVNEEAYHDPRTHITLVLATNEERR